MEPEKIDKDCVRDWVKSVCDPYKDEIPEIPLPIIEKAQKAYKEFYESIIAIKDKTNPKNHVVIISGSDSDHKHVNKIKYELSNLNIGYTSYVASAHKSTELVLSIIKKYGMLEQNIVWVTIAGRSNALSGVVASNCNEPVIACPPFKDKMDMCVNINSTLQCPSNVPVMTILEPQNVALSIKRIFSV